MGFKRVVDHNNNERYERIAPPPLAEQPWWCRCAAHSTFEMQYDGLFLKSIGIVPEVYPLSETFTNDAR